VERCHHALVTRVSEDKEVFMFKRYQNLALGLIVSCHIITQPMPGQPSPTPAPPGNEPHGHGRIPDQPKGDDIKPPMPKIPELKPVPPPLPEPLKNI